MQITPSVSALKHAGIKSSRYRLLFVAFLITIGWLPLALGAAVTAPIVYNDDNISGANEDWYTSIFAMNNNSGYNTTEFQLSSGAQTLTLGSVVGGLTSIDLTGLTIFTLTSGDAQPVVTALDGTPGNPGMGVTFTETQNLQFDNSGLQLSLLGAEGSAVTLLNSNFNGGAIGSAGGDAWVSVGNTLSLGTGSALNLAGGTGGAVSLEGDGTDGIDTASSAVIQGGNGGQAGLTAGTLALSNSNLTLMGGTGGSLGLSAANSGMAIFLGNASSSLTVTSGNGGNAFVSAGAVSLSQAALSVNGGTGGNMYINSASGGHGIYSLGPLSVTSGNGGDASVTAASVSLAGSALSVAGGTGGSLTITTNGGIGISGYSYVGVNSGNGGNAGVSLGSLNMDGTSTISLSGGTGGQSSLVVRTYNDGSAFAIIGSLTGSGTVTMDGSTSTLQVASGTFSGLISGNESLDISGGALTLTGANTYTGGTTVSGIHSTLNIQTDGNIGNYGLVLDGGVLQAGGNGLDLFGTVTLTPNGGVFDSNGNNSILLGLIDGSGGLAVTNSTGTGTLGLTGNNSYSGGTTLSAGELIVSNVNALGTGSVWVQGGSLKIFVGVNGHIGGNYSQAAAGSLLLSMSGTGAGDWSQLNVGGTSTLSGNLDLIPVNGFQFHIHDTASFTLLTSGSLSGTFTTFTNNIPGDTVSLVYGSDDLLIDVTGPTFLSLASTLNQRHVAAALDQMVSQNPNASLITALNTQADSALPDIYDQLSPANLAPMFQIEFSTAQAEAGMVSQRLAGLLSDSNSLEVAWNGTRFAGDLPASAEAGIGKNLQPEQWGVFASGLGDFGTVSSDGNGPGYQFSTGGMVAGMDYRFSKEWAGGLLLGYTSSGTGQSTATVNATGGQLGLYTGWEEEGFHLNALLEGGLNSYTTLRNGLGGTASGNTQGQMISGQLGLGYELKTDQLRIGPFLSGQYTSVSLNAFNETGSALGLLDYGAQSAGSFNSDIGLAANRSWDLGGWTLTPSLSAAWEHYFQGNVDSLSASFGSGPNFTVNGSSAGADAVILAAGVNALLGKGFNLYAAYQGKVGMTNYSEGNLSGGVNFGF